MSMLATLQTIALKANSHPVVPYRIIRHVRVKLVDLKCLGKKQERDEVEPIDLEGTNEE